MSVTKNMLSALIRYDLLANNNHHKLTALIYAILYFFVYFYNNSDLFGRRGAEIKYKFLDYKISLFSSASSRKWHIYMYLGQLFLDINKSIKKAISSPSVPLTYVVRNTGITKKKLRYNWTTLRGYMSSV